MARSRMCRRRPGSPTRPQGVGVAVCDYDRDGDPDIYVANDMVRNFLYRNNGDGTFTDVAYGAGVGFDPTASRRPAWAWTAATSTATGCRTSS